MGHKQSIKSSTASIQAGSTPLDALYMIRARNAVLRNELAGSTSAQRAPGPDGQAGQMPLDHLKVGGTDPGVRAL